MAEATVPYGRKTQRAPAVKEVHVLWITAGLELRRRLGLDHRRDRTTEGDFGANAFQLCGRTFGPEADHFFGQGVTGHCGTSIEIRMTVARLDADDSDIARERIAARVS